MVKLVQAKYIKQLFIFLFFASLLSYQQNAKAENSRDVVIQIMANTNLDTNLVSDAASEALFVSENPLNSSVLGLLAVAVSGEDNILLGNYFESRLAFNSVLQADTVTYDSLTDSEVKSAATIVTVDAMALLVSLIDELIVLGETANMDSQREDVAGSEAYNPIVAASVALGQIAAYSEVFEGFRGFIRSGLDNTSSAGRSGIKAMRGAFDSGRDYLSGDALQQTPECSSLFCSLYTLRLENPDESVDEFAMSQILMNEFFDGLINPGRNIRHAVDRLIDGAAVNDTLNSLRQSRAATETVLPGNDPNAVQQQQQQQQEPVISEECRMAPSLPGC
jgi:hypothetical protein